MKEALILIALALLLGVPIVPADILGAAKIIIALVLFVMGALALVGGASSLPIFHRKDVR